MKKSTAAQYGLLVFALLFFSLSSLCLRFSAQYPVMSGAFILFYALSIIILMVYAVLWQKILKYVELSRAYALKPFSMILSMIWGVMLFHERITWNMIIGTGMILLGIRMVVKSRNA